MSETLHVGQPVVCRDASGATVKDLGIGGVTCSDISRVVAEFRGGETKVRVNAGTLKWGELTLSAATDADWKEFESILAASERKKLNTRQVADLQCQTCLWWRQPFDTGPGNCHHEQVKQLTNIGGETYAPPTPAHFGCVQWESKDQPENGDE